MRLTDQKPKALDRYKAGLADDEHTVASWAMPMCFPRNTPEPGTRSLGKACTLKDALLAAPDDAGVQLFLRALLKDRGEQRGVAGGRKKIHDMVTGRCGSSRRRGSTPARIFETRHAPALPQNTSCRPAVVTRACGRRRGRAAGRPEMEAHEVSLNIKLVFLRAALCDYCPRDLRTVNSIHARPQNHARSPTEADPRTIAVPAIHRRIGSSGGDGIDLMSGDHGKRL